MRSQSTCSQKLNTSSASTNHGSLTMCLGDSAELSFSSEFTSINGDSISKYSCHAVSTPIIVEHSSQTLMMAKLRDDYYSKLMQTYGEP